MRISLFIFTQLLYVASSYVKVLVSERFILLIDSLINWLNY